MSNQNITIKGISRTYMNEIVDILNNEVVELSERYYRLKNEEHLAYEILSTVYRKNNKVYVHHTPLHKYNFIVSKGEAWFLWFYFSNKAILDQSAMLTYICLELHKKIA